MQTHCQIISSSVAKNTEHRHNNIHDKAYASPQLEQALKVLYDEWYDKAPLDDEEYEKYIKYSDYVKQNAPNWVLAELSKRDKESK